MTEPKNSVGGFCRSLLTRKRGLAMVSLLLSAATAAILLARPELHVDGAPWLDRIALAFVVVGLIGAFIHGVGAMVTRRLALIASDPRFCWPAMILGLAWLIWRNG